MAGKLAFVPRRVHRLVVLVLGLQEVLQEEVGGASAEETRLRCSKIVVSFCNKFQSMLFLFTFCPIMELQQSLCTPSIVLHYICLHNIHLVCSLASSLLYLNKVCN